VQIGPVRSALRADVPVGRARRLPERLRSLLAVPTWGRRPEPRVRYGQPFVPGLAALGRQYVNEARPVLERADAVRGRRFTYYGRTVGFPGRIDWEPRGLSEAWRVALNSLDDLEAIGVAAALAPTADVRRRWYEVAAAHVREWIAAEPAGRGVGWSVPALARRIPNLIQLQVFFAQEIRADAGFRRALLDSLMAQAPALAAAVPGHPRDHDLIAAARALFSAGRFFDGLEARGWLETGSALLWEQLREQIGEDGGHRSRNLAVHLLVLADYLEVVAFLQAANDDVPIWARKRVKAMVDFLARCLHPDGEIALFHGAAIGRARPAREVLTAAAIVLHEPGLAPPGDLPGVWPLLVVGESGRRVHAHLPRRREPAEPRALRRTGFYVLPGDAGDVMLLDGDAPPPGGDANVFGYELSVGGTRLIVDAGAGGDDGAAWGEYFRSTRAHNVLAVGGAEQIAKGRMPAVSEVQWVVRDGLLYFGGVHDGFARLSLDLRLRHRRRVFCLPGRFWIVCDEILGSGADEWEAESFVHFHPEVTIEARCNRRLGFIARRGESAWLQLVPSGAGEVRVGQGIDGPRPQGWYAARAGERRPAPVVSFPIRGELPLVFGYALLPRSEAPTSLAFEYDAFRLAVSLRTGEADYRISVVQGDLGMVVRGTGGTGA